MFAQNVIVCATACATKRNGHAIVVTVNKRERCRASSCGFCCDAVFLGASPKSYFYLNLLWPANVSSPHTVHRIENPSDDGCQPLFGYSMRTCELHALPTPVG